MTYTEPLQDRVQMVGVCSDDDEEYLGSIIG
jgi:hypothetical protein